MGHGTSEHLSSPLIRSSLQSCNTAVETGGHPVCHSLWPKILCRGDLKNVQPIIAKARKTNDRRWSRVAATRDLPTIAFFRAGVLLRRGVPVPGILATHRPGKRRLWVSLGASSLVVSDPGNKSVINQKKTDPHTKKLTLPFIPPNGK